MSEENNVQQNEETAVSQTDNQPTQDDSVDYKALYLEEIQNSKKYRKRAQESETANKDFLKQQETAKVKTLTSQEKYRELYEETQKKYDSILSYKDRWEQHEAPTRDSLLSELPENDREMLKGKDLETLSYIVNQRKELSETHRPNNPRHTSGKVDTNNVSDKPFKDMSEDDLKGNWKNVIENYKRKHELNNR